MFIFEQKPNQLRWKIICKKLQVCHYNTLYFINFHLTGCDFLELKLFKKLSDIIL